MPPGAAKKSLKSEAVARGRDRRPKLNQIRAHLQFQPAGATERGLFEARRADPAKPDERYQLILRFAAVNTAVAALLAAAFTQGWVEEIFVADTTGLVVVIALVFAVGWCVCAWRIWRVDAELNACQAADAVPGSLAGRYLEQARGADAGGRSMLVSSLRIRLFGPISVVRYFANSLVLLGLIGTVVGFVIALSGVDAQSASDVKAISPMVSRLLSGMSVALYTTLVGAALNLWLTVNYHILHGAAATLLAKIIDAGESHA